MSKEKELEGKEITEVEVKLDEFGYQILEVKNEYIYIYSIPKWQIYPMSL